MFKIVKILKIQKTCLKFLKSQKEDRFEKFIDYLTQNNIKFEKGDWQSFDSNTFNQTTKTTKLNSNDLQKAIKEGTALADLSELWKLKLKFEEHKKKLSADELANYKKSELEEKVDREMKHTHVLYHTLQRQLI